MTLLDRLNDELHEFAKLYYYEPTYIILNPYTYQKLEAEIYEEELMNYWAELGNHNKFRGIPILQRMGNYEEEIDIELIKSFVEVHYD